MSEPTDEIKPPAPSEGKSAYVCHVAPALLAEMLNDRQVWDREDCGCVAKVAIEWAEALYDELKERGYLTD